MIRFEHVEKTFFNKNRVLKDVNGTVNKGDVVVIIGPSGTGKSTLLRCINMLDAPTGGRIFLDGEEITQKGYPIQKIHKKVCMVFQSFNLFEHLSVIENVMLPQVAVRKMDRQAAYDKGMELLSTVGMAMKADAYPSSLSGGQKQRVAIARTLAMQPKVILFDEPTSALDPSSVAEVKNVIKKVAKLGVTCLIVTHDMDLAKEIANRVFYMDQGLIYEEGTPDEIFEHPKKERTLEFVKKFKSIEEEITDRAFDYPALMAKIQDYCTDNLLPASAVLNTQLLTEELIYSILFPRLMDPFKLYICYEYDKNESQMKMALSYSGKKQNIFEPIDIEGSGEHEMKLEEFRGIIRLIMAKLEGFEYSYHEEKSCPNTIIMRLKKDTPVTVQ